MAGLDSKSQEEYDRILKSHNIVHLVKAGSHLTGLADADSDRDEMGVFIESPDHLLGFSQKDTLVFRTAEYRTGNSGAKSESGDIDLTLYGLRKFLSLALGGNPTILSLLYAPKNMRIVDTSISDKLLELAPSIVSIKALDAFLGYMKQQHLRMQGLAGQMRVTRSDIISQYGYDVVYASHILRLGFQGCRLAYEGALRLPMPKNELDMIRDCKTGQYTLSTFNQYYGDLENSLFSYRNKERIHNLPDKPNVKLVEDWMLSVYLDAWAVRANQSGEE